MYRMSLITMLAPTELSQRLDIPRCTKMALIHDMAEGLVGDLTPVDGVPKAEKSRREAETMDWVATSLLGRVNKGLSGKEIRDCWQEYEDGETLESRFVHDVDKIELLLQMVEYERESECRLDLSEFSWVSKRVGLAEMKVWAEDILEERRILWEKAGREPREPSEKAAIREGQEEYYGNGEDGANGNALLDANGHAN
jgi:putative hydrolases of HD superfamily